MTREKEGKGRKERGGRDEMGKQHTEVNVISGYGVGCRYLGYVLYNEHEAGTGPIWLDEVQCKGSELDLGQCSHQPWGYNDCNHQEDVYVACYVRIKNTARKLSGKITNLIIYESLKCARLPSLQYI